MGKRAMDNNLQYLDLITMTWIMLILSVVQAKHPLPLANTFSTVPGKIYPTLKASRICKEECKTKCEFHFEPWPAIYEVCYENCLLL